MSFAILCDMLCMQYLELFTYKSKVVGFYNGFYVDFICDSYALSLLQGFRGSRPWGSVIGEKAKRWEVRMTTVAAEYDHIDIQQQYQDTVNNRWDEEWDNENSSARLFERSRIKALAGEEASLTGLHPRGPWGIPCMTFIVWNKGAFTFGLFWGGLALL